MHASKTDSIADRYLREGENRYTRGQMSVYSLYINKSVRKNKRLLPTQRPFAFVFEPQNERWYAVSRFGSIITMAIRSLPLPIRVYNTVYLCMYISTVLAVSRFPPKTDVQRAHDTRNSRTMICDMYVRVSSGPTHAVGIPKCNNTKADRVI